jgi:hypothetical protein
MNYTKYEESEKLKKLCFYINNFECGYKVGHDDMGLVVMTPQSNAQYLIDINIPAYTSDQLFEWLRKRPVPNWYWDMNAISIMFYEIDEFGTSEEWTARLKYETNLTDMLAKAVIWVLEQEVKR